MKKIYKKKVHFLRLLSVFIFAIYFLTLWVSLDFLNNFIKVLFIILFIYILNSWCVKRILIFYWDEVEISWEKYFRKWYKASFFSFLTQTIFFGIGFFLAIETLGVDNYLQLWGIIAWVIAFFGFTATVRAPDVISWIIILHNDRIQIWNVVYIKELWVYAWVKRISLTEIKLIDLRYSHPILIRPSKFRSYMIENLSVGIIGKKTSYPRNINIHVWYGIKQTQLEQLCEDAYTHMIEELQESEKKYFPQETKNTLEIEAFWDDAVEYTFIYHITSPFYLIKSEQILNKYLKKSQEKFHISFSTPKLIDIQEKA